jgi:hypothetical protein
MPFNNVSMRTPHIVLALLCLYVCIPQCSFAQRGLFWLGGFELGGNLSPYSFKQNGNILTYGIDRDKDDKPNQIDNGDAHHRGGMHNSINTSLYYRFSRRFGIEGGFSRNSIEFPMRDSRFQSTKDYDHANFDPTASYSSKYFALHYYTRDKSGVGLQFYFGGGMAFNHMNSPSGSEKSSYFDPISNQNLFLNGQFVKNFYSPFMETGIFFYNTRRRARSFLGVRYSAAPTLFTADYQNSQNNTILYQDHVAATGNSLTFYYKLGFALTKPKDELPERKLSGRYHYKVPKSYRVSAKHKPERDVLKARLLGCFGYDRPSGTSFWLYRKKNMYFLEKRDSSLNRVFVKELNLKSDESGLGRHDWVYTKNVTVKDKLTLFTNSGNAESTYTKITVHQFSLNGKETKTLNVSKLKSEGRNQVNVVWSSDSSKVSVVALQRKSKKNNTFRLLIKTLDHNLNQLYEANVELPGTDNIDTNEIFLQELSLKNKGELFVIGDVFMKTNPDSRFLLWAFNPVNKKISEVKVGVNNISALLFKKNQDETNVVGFYHDASRGSDFYNTLFYGKLNPDRMIIDSLKDFAIERERNPSNDAKGSKYKFVSIFNHKNGAIISTESWSLQGPTRLVAIDNEGNLKYSSTVKGQGFLFHDLTWFNEGTNSLQTIYNERVKSLMIDNRVDLSKETLNKKVVPLIVSIDSLGNSTRKLLPVSDSSNVIWRPYLSYKIDDDQILIAGKKSGKYRFAKAKISKQTLATGSGQAK